MMRRAHLLVLLLALALQALAVGAASVASRRNLRPPPSLDDFYLPPDDLDDLALGAVVRERDVETVLGPAKQLLYRTQTATEQPDVTVATVFTPKKPAPGPPRILIHGQPQDSPSYDCSPSWSFVRGPTSLATFGTGILGGPAILAALFRGWHVVMPDHQGSQAAFIVGYQSGRAMIDSLRAFLNHRTESLREDCEGYSAAIYGYSGGGHAAVWANTLASTYGSDLNILGAAHGGTIISLRPLIDFINAGLFAGFGAAGIAGVSNAYPELKRYIDEVAYPNGTQALDFVRRNQSGCILEELAAFAFKDVKTYVKVPNIFDQPIPAKYLADNSLSLPLQKPAYMWHGRLDQIVPLQQARDYVSSQCANGAKIRWVEVFPLEHLITLLEGLPSAFAWLQDLFDDKLEQDHCTNDTRVLGWSSNETETILGPDAVAAARALDGMHDGPFTVRLPS